MSCRQYWEELNLFVDGRSNDTDAVAAHVAECDECADTLRGLIQLRANLAVEAAPAGFRASVMERVREQARPGFRERVRAGMWVRNGAVGLTLAAAAVAAVYLMPSRAVSGGTIEGRAALAAMTEMHSEVQIAYALPADSPTTPAPDVQAKGNSSDTDYLYSQDGM